MKELERLLAPLKKAVIKNNMINFCTAALVLGLLADIAIAAASKFTLIINCAFWLAAVPFLLAFGGLLAAVLFAPKTKKLCEIADSMGLDERCITAYELLINCKNDEIHLLEITDALDHLKTKDLEKEYRPRLPLFLFKCCAAAALVLFVVVLLPSPKREQLDEQLDVHKKAMDEYEKVKDDAKKITDAKTEKVIKKELRSLKGKLAKAKTTQQAVQAIRDSQQELKKIEKENSKLSKLSQALLENENTKALGEALQSGNIEKTKQQLQAMNEAVKNMSQEELSELGNALSQASKQLDNDDEAKQLLNELGEAMKDNKDYQEISQLGEQLKNTIEQQAQNNTELKKAVDEMNKSLEKSANNMEGKPQTDNNSQDRNNGEQGKNGEQCGNGGEQGQNGEQGGNGGEQGQNGEQDQSGQNSENGSQNENGSNSEQGGNSQGGNGGQSENENQNSRPGGSSQGSGHIDNENIYTKLNGGNKNDVQLSGKEDENGGYTRDKNTGDGPAGEMVPYNTVVEQYKSDALEGISGGSLPSGMENIVKDYFTGLD